MSTYFRPRSAKCAPVAKVDPTINNSASLREKGGERAHPAAKPAYGTNARDPHLLHHRTHDGGKLTRVRAKPCQPPTARPIGGARPYKLHGVPPGHAKPVPSVGHDTHPALTGSAHASRLAPSVPSPLAEEEWKKYWSRRNWRPINTKQSGITPGITSGLSATGEAKAIVASCITAASKADKPCKYHVYWGNPTSADKKNAPPQSESCSAPDAAGKASADRKKLEAKLPPVRSLLRKRQAAPSSLNPHEGRGWAQPGAGALYSQPENVSALPGQPASRIQRSGADGKGPANRQAPRRKGAEGKQPAPIIGCSIEAIIQAHPAGREQTHMHTKNLRLSKSLAKPRPSAELNRPSGTRK